jgi:hypothetical protein
VPLVGVESEDETGVSALVSDAAIAFNGAGADSGEAFVLRPAPSDFECVKTYGRPYDLIVASVLIVAKHHAPREILDVTSDDPGGGHGPWGAWRAALEMCESAGVKISSQSIALLEADVAHESEPYCPPRRVDERELDAEWARIWESKLLRSFCEQRFPATFLKYQSASRAGSGALQLKLRRSIDARSLPPGSPVLQQKASELQASWNEIHRIKIVAIEIG